MEEERVGREERKVNGSIVCRILMRMSLIYSIKLQGIVHKEVYDFVDLLNFF